MPSNVKPHIRDAVLKRDNWRCLYCLADLRHLPPLAATVDHVVPRSKGGHHGLRNLIAACRSCNSARQTRPWVEFASPEARRRINRALARTVELQSARAARRRRRMQLPLAEVARIWPPPDGTISLQDLLTRAALAPTDR